MMRRRVFALSAVALLCTVFLSANPEHPDPNKFPTILSEPRVDVLADGKVVINFETSGAYKGLLTLNLVNDGSGYRGDWVLAVRHTDNTDPATGEEPPNHGHETPQQHENAAAAGDSEHPHRDYVRYVDHGTLAGAIDAAAFDVDAAGALIDFRAQLTITLGTLNFDGARGTGLVELTRGLALAF
jgi:hypothetical protein